MIDELTLIRQAQSGDRHAQGQLITMHQKFIWSIVHKYSIAGVDPDDLFQTGCIGFLERIQSYNPESGYKLITWCVFGIRKRLHIAIAHANAGCRQGETVSLDDIQYNLLPAPEVVSDDDDLLINKARTYVSKIKCSKLRKFANDFLFFCAYEPSATMTDMGKKYGASRELMRQKKLKLLKTPAMRELRLALHNK